VGLLLSFESFGICIGLDVLREKKNIVCLPKHFHIQYCEVAIMRRYNIYSGRILNMKW
jgi:hypothetical protein